MRGMRRSKIEVRSIDVFRMKNGKIDLAQEYYDQTTLLRQLGIEKISEIPARYGGIQFWSNRKRS